MAYEALLFCPEEKTARTVTQILAELEFSVDPCTEPFAAVKKLMGQHFDAIVVDCDNEQNATLLFKSARNSTSNQASLAVAIVEGQAGVAKAFRIGANLVLTKPINVEQSKGTLRVARGLLRKSEPGKPASAAMPTPAAPVPAPTPAPAPKPLATKPMPAVRLATPAPIGARPAATVKPPGIPPARPASPPAPAKTVAAPAAAVTANTAMAAAPAPAPLRASAPGATPSAASFVGRGSAAASAPAPAREAQPAATPAIEPKTSEAAKKDEPKASTAEAIQTAATFSAPAPPSFTFGGADSAKPSSGAGKKVIFGLVAAVAIAAAAYGGWSYFGHRSQFVAKTTAATAVTPAPQPATQPPSSARTEAAAAESPSDLKSAGDTAAVEPKPENNGIEARSEKSAGSSKPSAKPSAAPSAVAPSKSTPADAAAEEAPLVVKGGSEPHTHSAPAAADAQAPSVIGMATPDSGAPVSEIVADQPVAKPVLQKMKVSQGVAQGLILKRVAPEYPKNALMMRIEGTVELAATISKEGDIKDVKVLSGNAQLSRAAVQAVKQWKYKPYLLNGEPVEMETQITMDFKLPQ